LSDRYPRDMVGYGRHPPDPQWPGAARMALSLVLNYEEGSEYSVPDGDGRSEATMTDAGAADLGVKGRDLAAESLFEYGSRVGFWRLHDMFRDRDLPVTVSGAALALERNPEAAAAIREAGWEVLCHGWRWVEQFNMDEATERAHIARAVASLRETVGVPPVGWYCRYGPSLNTRRLLIEQGGFLYDSNSYADDLPFWVREGSTPFLVVPHTFSHNDNKYGRGWFATSTDFLTYMTDAFDFMYRESGRKPRLMSLSLHLRVSGHAARAVGVERFLDHVLGHRDVWIATRADIARHWIATHPAAG
jgi:peptidoglycan/xylan/chitin deacetylase (PgdA/CDA1 family)